MLLTTGSHRITTAPGTPPLEHAFYFIGLQNGFVLSLQNGQTLGYLVRFQ